MIPMPSMLEISAILFTTICIYLAGRNNIHTWWTGIVGCILYGLVFYEAKLYADVLLQVFFVGTGVMGWIGWNMMKDERPITSISLTMNAVVLAIGLAVGYLYSMFLVAFTDAAAPFWDSLILVGSVIAQIMLMRRHIQTWPMWIMVNTIAVPLFWSRDLHLSSILYAFYWVHAFWAMYKWYRMSQDHPTPSFKDGARSLNLDMLEDKT